MPLTTHAHLDETLFEEFSIQSSIVRFADCINSSVDFDRLGIATRVSRSEMEVLALYAGSQARPGHRGRRFDYRGTVGEWVWKKKQPFIGKSREEVRAFPSTYRQFESDGMQSNCVISLVLPGRGPTFIYWLSRKKAAYSPQQIPSLQRACDYLKPLIVAGDEVERVRAQAGNPLDRAMNQLFEGDSVNKSAGSYLPTLNEMQVHYIRRVLDSVNGVIEGADGAAAILGLAPSTLRSRIQRLNIERPNTGS